ncbi:MAG TPA: PD-(D/E)XK nuclease family protein [Terracidiphilus sp.]|nr:PD-(D/E)XK nuclease family protein [Terracidiphilus sp.]
MIEIDQWLRDGGFVLAASERAARALQSAFHARRRAEGLTAWPSPAIHTWAGFARAAWETRAGDPRMLLNAAQEQALWSGILAGETHLAALLAGPRHRLAALAAQAHDLLCSYAPRYLARSARTAWDRDPGAFNGWLAAFEAECKRASVLSAARAPLDAIVALREDTALRPPLLLVGFDRLTPVQREFLDAWGTWRALAADAPAADLRFYGAPDEATELAACAAWCMQRIADDPSTQLLVVTPDIGALRGTLERAFLRAAPRGSAPQFEFSLGLPLAEVPLPRAALLLLRWLQGSLLESELDWLFSTGLAAADRGESTALPARMRALRRAGLGRPQWTLAAFTAPARGCAQLSAAWLLRMAAAVQQLAAQGGQRQTHFDWAALIPQLLDAAGFPGRKLVSSEFQAWQRWQQALDTCASLGFDGRRVSWPEFLGDLARILSETLFAPESAGAPITITGSAESAGLTADAIWFLGATEDAWPSAGHANPLLPLAVQREHGMPHATPQLDWERADAVTARLALSAPVVRFSYARRTADSEARPSHLAVHFAAAPQPLPAGLAAPLLPPRATDPFPDTRRVPFLKHAIAGGAAVLTAQSQCGFKAFATARLGARGWQAAEFGLSAAQRGQLLHAVLHSIWGGPPHGLRSHAELVALADREAFVATHVERAMRGRLHASLRERMPQRYLALEGERLTHLIGEWLAFETTRVAFTVERVEAPGNAQVSGLSLALRLDRIDRLTDGSLAVIDYKTGDVSKKLWDLPRPDDVQLPLYAAFALGSEPGGLLFARLRAGDLGFAGRMRDAGATLLAGLSARDALMKDKLTGDQMLEWRESIEQLAHDFVAGRADADPRAYPETCKRCGLQTLCRIHESRAALARDEDDEAGDD